jgi:hypothetical protein
LLIEEVSDVAGCAGRLIISESILVEAANTASSRALNTETTLEDVSWNTVCADRSST